MVFRFPKHISTLRDVIISILLLVPLIFITIGNFILWLITNILHGITACIKTVIALIVASGRLLLLAITWPLRITVGKLLQRKTRIKKKKKSFIRWLITKPQTYVGITIGAVMMFFLFFLPYEGYQFLKALPNPLLLSNRPIPVTTKIFDRNDNLLFEFYGEQNRTPIALSDVPPFIKQATIAVEDKEFYQHVGFSLRGITRAVRETFFNKRVQGGSTITQQLIKNALLTPETSYTRKIKEIILSFWAERIYTKDQILEMYFNQVPYGGIYWGIESAARGYFGKSASQLSLAEGSFLVGLPAAPTFYSPYGEHPDQAKERQKEVLRRMTEDGYITKQQADDAIIEELTFIPQNLPIQAPHFVMYVKDVLIKRYGLRMVEQGGLRVKTSLDLKTQSMAEETLKTELDKIASLHVGNGAVLVTNPKTGEILAMVGSKDFFDKGNQGNVNLTTSLRQPGSSIKVVTYAAALQHGFTAASLLDDTPVVYTTPAGTAYAPVNYDGRFHGKVPLRYALGNSFNIPAVRTLATIGLDTMINQARTMGIKSWDDTSRFGLSLTLGSGEVTMVDMAAVYGTLANNGNRTNPDPILDVTTYTGELLEKKQEQPVSVRALPSGVAFIMSDILADNQARTTAFGPTSALVIPNKYVSVKTGTTDNKKDNWTIGYTPSYLVAVWVGNNDNSPMNPTLTSGVTGAAPIWQRVMTNLLQDKPSELPKQPDDVVSVSCFYGRKEYFIKGTEPKAGCPLLFPVPSSPISPGVPTPNR